MYALLGLACYRPWRVLGRLLWNLVLTETVRRISAFNSGHQHKHRAKEFIFSTLRCQGCRPVRTDHIKTGEITT